MEELPKKRVEKKGTCANQRYIFRAIFRVSFALILQSLTGYTRIAPRCIEVQVHLGKTN